MTYVTQQKNTHVFRYIFTVLKKPAQTLVVYHNERHESCQAFILAYSPFLRETKIMRSLRCLFVLCACVFVSLFQL
jgi:hypothetical protein